MGRPIGTGCRPGASYTQEATSTVASVGPYALTSPRPRDQWAITSAGGTSPPVMIIRRSGSAIRGRPDITAGVRCACVTLRSARNAASSSPASTPGGITRQEPVSRERHSSETLASKLGEISCATRLPVPAP